MEKKMELWKLVSGYKKDVRNKDYYSFYDKQELECRNLLDTIKEYDNKKVSEYVKLDNIYLNSYLEKSIYEVDVDDKGFYIHLELPFIIIGQLFKENEKEINLFLTDVEKTKCFNQKGYIKYLDSKDEKTKNAIFFIHKCIGGAVFYDVENDNMNIDTNLIRNRMNEYIRRTK